MTVNEEEMLSKRRAKARLYKRYPAVLGLLLVRFFVIFSKTACIHCYAKYKYPQAEAMAVRNMQLAGAPEYR
jgi:hypothetical protein